MMETNKKRNFDSILLKGGIIAVITLLMLIPITMVTSIIEERAENKDVAIESITSKWGGSQYVTGPIMVVPFEVKEIQTTYRDGKKELITSVETNYAYFLPDKYIVSGNLDTEERSISIYKALLYQSQLKLEGSFAKPDLKALDINPESVRWADVTLLLGISHMQGVSNKVQVQSNGEMLEVIPGVINNSVIRSGLTIKMPMNGKDLKANYDFKLDLNLNGSQELYVAPIGKENDITLKSAWKTVLFAGDFLPHNRTLNDAGFDANWKVYDYNRNYVSMWVGRNNTELPSLGVELKSTVEQYQMGMRAVKYAIMFIALTFVVFFFVEILTGKRIHPIQYLLVSFGLVMFYTLLVSLSEHIHFDVAYLISSVAIVTLITLYCNTIFDKKIHTLAMGAFITALYIYLYVILQLETMSLLMGSIGLFVILAGVMFASRKVDWYKTGSNVMEERE